jgi:hypothetical protein
MGEGGLQETSVIDLTLLGRARQLIFGGKEPKCGQNSSFYKRLMIKALLNRCRSRENATCQSEQNAKAPPISKGLCHQGKGNRKRGQLLPAAEAARLQGSRENSKERQCNQRNLENTKE